MPVWCIDVGSRPLSVRPAASVTCLGSLAYEAASTGDSSKRISASIRSAIFCAGSRSWAIVQLAAYPRVASLGRAWLTGCLVSEGGEHQLALGDGDEAVAQAVEPELGSPGLADAGVEMMRLLDMAGRAGRLREYPLADAFG